MAMATAMTQALTPVGFLGAGPFAQPLARRAVAAGRPIVLSNSRGPETLADLTAELGPLASAATLEDVATMPLVLLVIPWTIARKVLYGLPAWDNRILVDVTNHYLNYDPPVWDTIGDQIGAEMIAAAAPGARVVRALGSLAAGDLDVQPDEGRGRRVMFISGDDADATATVSELTSQLGFAPIVLGDLKHARLHQLGGPLMEVPLTRL